MSEKFKVPPEWFVMYDVKETGDEIIFHDKITGEPAKKYEKKSGKLWTWRKETEIIEPREYEVEEKTYVRCAGGKTKTGKTCKRGVKNVVVTRKAKKIKREKPYTREAGWQLVSEGI